MLTFHLISKAQSVTYNDLKFVLYNEIGKVENYLSYKKFNFIGIDSALIEENHFEYVFIKNEGEKIKYVRVSKRLFNGIFYESTFQSYQQDDYLKFKKSIMKVGFKLVKTEIKNDIFHNIYKKGNLEINIFLSNSSGQNIHNYDINLVDIKLNPSYNRAIF